MSWSHYKLFVSL